jgi:Arc/MetJ-type ribon-helix-helix transcriptional regulator
MNNERKQEVERRKDRFMMMAGLIGSFGAGAFAGSKRQQIALTMDPREVAEMDLLIEQGLYSSREDFLQTAARKLLREHNVEIQPVTGQLTVAGPEVKAALTDRMR